MSIRRLKCINIHFIHNIQNRHQDDEFSLGIDTLDTLYARIIIHKLTEQMLSRVTIENRHFIPFWF